MINRSRIVIVAAVTVLAGRVVFAQHEPAATAPASDALSVELLDAGQAPRRALRYQPKVDQSQTIEMTIKPETKESFGGMPLPSSKAPSTRLVTEARVKSVDAEGNGQYEFTFTTAEAIAEPGVTPQALQVSKQSMAALQGLTGSAVMTARGVKKDVTMQSPAGARPANAELLDRVSSAMQLSGVVLPEEEVGAGAKWRIVAPMDRAGANFTETATYELVQLEGSVATLKIEIKLEGGRQPLRTPDGGRQNNVELAEITGSGQGRAVIDLTNLLPREAQLEQTTTRRMEADLGGTAQEITMELKLTTSIKTLKPDAAAQEEPAGDSGPRGNAETPSDVQPDNHKEKRMAIKVGDTAPAFKLPDKPKNVIDVGQHLGKEPVVLLFFPLAFSSVCTAEMCHMRDNWQKFESIGAKVFGISVDSPFVTDKFRQSENIPFPILSDFNKEVARQYGVLHEDLMGLKGVAKRSAFVIGADGKVKYAWIGPEPGEQVKFDEIEAALNGE